MNLAIRDQKLISIIRQTVATTIREVLDDPDRGQELQPWVIRRLNKYKKSGRASKTISLEALKKKHS